jgi:hypothetical protein
MASTEMNRHERRRALKLARSKQSVKIEKLAYSVEEFCQLHGISIGHFYNLLKAGLAPDIMKVGTRTLISEEAAALWRAERTAASSNDAA